MKLTDQLHQMPRENLINFTIDLINSLVAVADGKQIHDLIDDGHTQLEAILIVDTTSTACAMLNKEN